MPKRLIIIHIKSWQSVRSLTNPKCKCVMFLCTIFNIVVKIVFFLKRILVLRFRLCKMRESFQNEMTRIVSAKPCFIYRINFLYDRNLLPKLE